MKAKAVLLSLLLGASLLACETPTPITPSPTVEATPSPIPATPTPTIAPTATPTIMPTPTPTTPPTPTPSAEELVWPWVVTKLHLGVPAGNGYYPHEVAVNPLTGRVYVHNQSGGPEGRGLLSVIEGATGEVVATVALGSSGWPPGRVAVDPDRGRVYVVSRGDKLLTVVEEATCQVLAEIEGVEDVAVDAAGGLVYVADGRSVRVLDADDLAELRRAPLAPTDSVVAMAVNPPADRLYIARAAPALDILAASTLETVATVPLASPVHDLAVNAAANRLYLSLSQEGENRVLTLDGTSGELLDSLAVGDEHQRSVLAVDEARGRLYVGRTACDTPGVTVLDEERGEIATPSGVEGLAVDPRTGHVYAALPGRHSVAVLDPDERAIAALVPVGIELVDLAVDASAGRLYVTDSADRLRILDAISYVELTALPGRGHMAVDEVRHRLYVNDPQGRGVQIVEGGRAVGLIPQAGRPAVDPAANVVYIVQRGVYIADPETREVVGRLEDTFPRPDLLSPNPYAVEAIPDPASGLLYVVFNNGVPGSNNANFLRVYRGATAVFTDTEGSTVSVAVDPARNLAYVARYRFGRGSLGLLAEGRRWVARLEGIAGRVLAHPKTGLAYLTDIAEDGNRLLAIEGGDLVASLPLDGRYTLEALDPLTDRLYLMGQGGEVLVVAGSGGSPPPPEEPRPVQLPASPVQAIVASPDYARDRTLFAILENRLYKSADGGATWGLVGGGLPADGWVTSVALSPHYADDGTLLAAASTASAGGGIYRSTDGGRSWRLACRGLSDLLVQGVAFAPDGTAYARTSYRGLFRSRDGGAHWEALWELPSDGPPDLRATALACAEDILLAGMASPDRSALLRSTDGGESWEEVLEGLVEALALGRSAYAALSGTGLWRSDDGGDTWRAANTGILYRRARFAALAAAPDGTAYALLVPLHEEGGRLYRSTDGGQSWQELKTDFRISAFALAGGSLLLGTAEGRIHSLPLAELEWREVEVGPEEVELDDLALSPQALYAASHEAGVFASEDGGRSWRETGFPGRGPSFRLAASPGGEALFVATGAGVYRSTDGGESWEELILLPAAAIAVSPAYAQDGTVFVGGDYRRPEILVSTDGGQSWQISQRFDSGVAQIALSPHFAADRTAYAWIEYEGLYRTEDGGASWQRVAEERDWYVQSLALSPDFAADRTIFVGALDGRLYKSTDGGLTWQRLDGLPPGTVWVKALALSPDYGRDGTVFVGLDVGVYKSTDGGLTWQAASAGLPSKEDGTPATVVALAISPHFAADGTLFAALAEGGVYKSTDGGQSWRLSGSE